MSSKYSEYLNLYLQMGKKYLYLTQVLRKVLGPNPEFPGMSQKDYNKT